MPATPAIEVTCMPLMDTRCVMPLRLNSRQSSRATRPGRRSPRRSGPARSDARPTPGACPRECGDARVRSPRRARPRAVGQNFGWPRTVPVARRPTANIRPSASGRPALRSPPGGAAPAPCARPARRQRRQVRPSGDACHVTSRREGCRAARVPAYPRRSASDGRRRPAVLSLAASGASPDRGALRTGRRRGVSGPASRR